MSKIAELLVGLFTVALLAPCTEHDVHHILEVVKRLLPTPIAFDPNLDTSKNHLFAATEIDT